MDVSVIITAFNKGQYIKKCLLGVLNQDFHGDFEIILADDCSTDNTREEINSLRQHRNFGKVKYKIHGKNKGLMGNFIWALNQARGKYLAFCDADDIWTDNNKLTFQVKILSTKPVLLMVGSLMELNDTRNQEEITYGTKYLENLKEGILEKEFFYNTLKVPFHISSFICRNERNLKEKLERFRFVSVSNDVVFWCLLSDIGDCYFSKKIVGIENHVINGITQIHNHLSLNYRLNKIIMWKTLSEQLKDKTLKDLAYFNFKNLHSNFIKRLVNIEFKLMINLLKNKNYPFAIWIFIIRTWLMVKLSRRLFKN